MNNSTPLMTINGNLERIEVILDPHRGPKCYFIRKRANPLDYWTTGVGWSRPLATTDFEQFYFTWDEAEEIAKTLEEALREIGD